jgi:hypothetical protein
MCLIPDNSRIANLKLHGFRLGALVYFCPRCDFEAGVERMVSCMCPRCHAALVLTTVTPDLVRMIRAA